MNLSCDDTDELTDEWVAYYLSQGRPMMAFHVVATKNSQWKLPLDLSLEEVKRLTHVALSAALHNVLNSSVVSSALCLLELCQIDTQAFRVDVQSARRICERRLKDDDHEDESWDMQAIVKLFLSFPEVNSSVESEAIQSTSLLCALRILEESTWILDPHASVNPHALVSHGNALTRSPWHLVALFCRVHRLPRSLTLLHELARNNDWVMFLHECGTQQCPPDIVLDVVSRYFTDKPLKNHMLIVVEDVCRLTTTKDNDLLLEAPKTDVCVDVGTGPFQLTSLDTADLLVLYRHNRLPWRLNPTNKFPNNAGWILLVYSLNCAKSQMTVVASCFEGIQLITCFTTWLIIQARQISNIDGFTFKVQLPPTSLTKNISTAKATSKIKTKNWRCWSDDPYNAALEACFSYPYLCNEKDNGGMVWDEAALCRVGEEGGIHGCSLIVNLCKNKHFTLVLRALNFFDHDNPIKHFILFHRAFVQGKFTAASQFLRTFVTNFNFPKKIFETAQLETLVNYTLANLLQDSPPTERRILLIAIENAQWSSTFSLLAQAHALIGTSMVDFRESHAHILQTLVEQEKYDDARWWAVQAKLQSKPVTIREEVSRLEVLRNSYFWESLDERMNHWNISYCAFIYHKITPADATFYFLSIIYQLEAELFAREQLLLFGFILKLLNSVINNIEGSNCRDSDKIYKIAELTQICALILVLSETSGNISYTDHKISFGEGNCENERYFSDSLLNQVSEKSKAKPLFAKLQNIEGVGNVLQFAISKSSISRRENKIRKNESKMIKNSDLSLCIDKIISTLINQRQLGLARKLVETFEIQKLCDITVAEDMEKLVMSDVIEYNKYSKISEELKRISKPASNMIDRYIEETLEFWEISMVLRQPFRTVAESSTETVLEELLKKLPQDLMINSGNAHRTIFMKIAAILKNTKKNQPIAEVIVKYYVKLVKTGMDIQLTTFCDQITAPDTYLLPRLNESDEERFLTLYPTSVNIGDETVKFLNDKTNEEVNRNDPCNIIACVELLIIGYLSYTHACAENEIHILIQELNKVVDRIVSSKWQHQWIADFALCRLMIRIPETVVVERIFNCRYKNLRNMLQIVKIVQDPPPLEFVGTLIELLSTQSESVSDVISAYYHFGLVDALADKLMNLTFDRLSRLRDKLKIYSLDGERQLINCLDGFTAVSKLYSKADKDHLHLAATRMAALLELQIKYVQNHFGELIRYPTKSAYETSIIINLSFDETQKVVINEEEFFGALTIVDAYQHLYGPRVHSVWPAALYEQGIVRGRRCYFTDYFKVSIIDSETADKILKIFVSDHYSNIGTEQVKNFRFFLENCVNDLSLRKKICEELLTDLNAINTENVEFVKFEKNEIEEVVDKLKR
eukprot:GHVL01031354.1.p1 GENE.GHVL01031354.1~~GHVL01031354.1.p1  ORF type:complete len:1378 (-),score=291.85 GHVL01031354.1:1623-5756(-)